jgi:hypothetical protein
MDEAAGGLSMTKYWAWSLCFILVFVVPWFVPVSGPVESDSYVFGFSNRAAVAGAVIGIALLSLLRLRGVSAGETDRASRVLARTPAGERLGGWVVGTWTLVHVATSVFLTATVFEYTYGEGAYFVSRIDAMSMGRSPYVDFEFAYGPLLLWGPNQLLHFFPHLPGGAKIAYGLWHALLSGLSVLLLAWIVNRFDMTRKQKVLLFCAFSFIAWNETRGVNQLLIRDLPPFAAILLAHYVVLPRLERQKPGPVREVTWGVFCVAAFWLCAAFSPEFGVVAGLALLSYTLLRVEGSSAKKLAVCGAQALGMGAIAASLPQGYWEAMIGFGTGGYLQPVVPAGYLLVYWASLLYAVPWLVYVLARTRENEIRGFIAALVVLILGLIPGALGRCDFLHVFWYGIPALVVAAVVAAAKSPRWFRTAVAVALLAFLVPKASHFLGYGSVIARNVIVRSPWAYDAASRSASLRPKIKRWKEEAAFSAGLHPDCERLAKYGRLLAPLNLSPATKEFLYRRGLLEFGYYTGCMNAVTPEQVRRKIKELETARIVIAPDWVMKKSEEPVDSGHATISSKLSELFVFPFRFFPVRNEPWYPETVVVDYLRANYQVVEEIRGDAILRRTTERKALSADDAAP